MSGPTTRMIGMLGTVARIGVGVILTGSVLYGHAAHGWHPAAWLLGLLVFPTAVFAAQWWWTRRRPAPLRATGPVGHLITLLAFLALYLTWWYAPAVDELSDAALLFYGGSMLVAAARGYAGCEVLAVSNWLLERDDQIGCAVFWPVDTLEVRIGMSSMTGGPGRAR
jgi:drug/metabolite transporter (DMT)-like permease